MPADARSRIRTRALRSYGAGEFRILTASTAAHADRPNYVEARVYGYQSDYVVRLTGGAWSCTCHQAGCPHAEMIKLATGHPSAAERTPKPVKEAPPS